MIMENLGHGPFMLCWAWHYKFDVYEQEKY
jgi:hypothetical protein